MAGKKQREDHTHDQAWSFPNETIVFTIWFAVIATLIVGGVLELATRSFLSDQQRGWLSAITALPILCGCAVLGWKISIRFWPGTPIDPRFGPEGSPSQQ